MPAAVVVFGESEAVAADDHSVLKDNVVAYCAELADNSMGMTEEVVSDASSAIDNHMSEENRVAADLNVIVNDHIRANVGARADLRRGMHDSSGVNSWRILRRLIEQFEGAGKVKIWIPAAQHCARQGREVFGHDHSGSFGGSGQRCVLGIR